MITSAAEHTPVDIHLDPEMVSYLRDETQAALAAGTLWMDEHDFLLVAGLSQPRHPERGIRDGESLVVARVSDEGFKPEHYISSALIDRHDILRDLNQPSGPSFSLLQSSDRPNILEGTNGRRFQLENRLYVPADAYGMWLQKSPFIHASRSEYLHLLPGHDNYRLHLGARAILS